MLDIILQILPWLGIILLVLLCIIAVFLLLILFSPVRYKISGKKDAEAFSLSARANWLFGLLRVRYAYPEPGKLTVKLLWFMLYDSEAGEHEEKATAPEKAKDKEKAEKKEKRKEKKAKGKVKAKKNTAGKAKDKTEVILEKRSEGKSDTVTLTAAGNSENADNTENSGNAGKTGNIKNIENAENTENTVNTDNIDKTADTGESEYTDTFQNEQSIESSETHERENSQGANWVSGKIEKIKFKICSVYDKIKKIWGNITYYISLIREEETHLLFSHTMKSLGRILRNIRPKKLRVNVLFGTGTPDITGYAFGIYCMLSLALGSGVVVTPDFEHTVLEGDLEATGTITSAVLAWHFLRVILDKRFWKFIDKLKKGGEPAGTAGTETNTKASTAT